MASEGPIWARCIAPVTFRGIALGSHRQGVTNGKRMNAFRSDGLPGPDWTPVTLSGVRGSGRVEHRKDAWASLTSARA